MKHILFTIFSFCTITTLQAKESLLIDQIKQQAEKFQVKLNSDNKEEIFLDMMKKQDEKIQHILRPRISVSIEGLLPSLLLSYRSQTSIDDHTGYGRAARISLGTTALIVTKSINVIGDVQFMKYLTPLENISFYRGPRVAALIGVGPRIYYSQRGIQFFAPAVGYTIGFETQREHPTTTFFECGLDVGTIFSQTDVIPFPYPRFRIGTCF